MAAGPNTAPWPDIWAYPTGLGCPSPRGSCTYPTPILPIQTAYRPVSLAWSPDESKVAVYSAPSGATGAVDIYSLFLGSLLASYPLTAPAGHADDVLGSDRFDVSNNWSLLTTAGFAGNGTETVSAPSDPYGADDGVAVRNIADGSLVNLIHVGQGISPLNVMGAALSNDGKTLAASVGWSVYASDSTALFDVASGALTGTVSNCLGQVAFLPDGQTLAAACPSPNSGGGALLGAVPLPSGAGAAAVAISPDGTKVAIARNVNPPTLQLYCTGVQGSCAAGDANSVLCFYKVSNGQLLTTDTQETGVAPGGMESLSYSPDGRSIYWARYDASSVLAKNPYYQPFLTGVSAPATVIGGSTVKGTVTLSANAPSGGMVVTLTSSRPEWAACRLQ